jgi:formylmethanofuran dehydrogenase subunit D
MTRPIISGINVETGEIVERELNDDEYAQHLADVEANKEMFPDDLAG